MMVYGSSSVKLVKLLYRCSSDLSNSASSQIPPAPQTSANFPLLMTSVCSAAHSSNGRDNGNPAAMYDFILRCQRANFVSSPLNVSGLPTPFISTVPPPAIFFNAVVVWAWLSAMTLSASETLGCSLLIRGNQFCLLPQLQVLRLQPALLLHQLIPQLTKLGIHSLQRLPQLRHFFSRHGSK